MVQTIPLIVEGRFTGLILFIVIIVCTLYYMSKGKLPYIRRVPAVDAIDEGVDRATELGRPVIISPGIAVAGIDYWTVSALSMLTHVARRCAGNDVPLLVPLGGSDQSYTMIEIARDLVQAQYRLEGKPEGYNVDNMPFLSGRQFAWASGYVGMMLRHKPATDIMVGVQWASAMYMSEVANTVGSMQISGTTYLSNIACLATSSDYVMIGEEQTAAGAYLSQDPVQLASIRTQDIIKGLAMIFLIVGVIALAMGSDIVKVILST
jgi:hypothetical protein